ncbi:MAG: cell division ATP-binding protein FtsE [Bdellovibrionales bacterium]|nr:cell division ATP-binding protein FtsE [Bdellovibrionales bacterium]
MIYLRSVKKEYPPDQVALGSVDMEVKAGEFIFVVGASGAGKSTLLKLLFGAERASEGEVLVGGRNLSAIDRDHIAELRRHVGVIFQDYKLLTRRNVLDNVAFGLEVRGVPQRKRRQLADRMLGAIGLSNKGSAMPLTLSGGEQQRVAVARALLTQPQLLLADEPTGNLDPKMARIVLDLLLEANSAGTTVLLATHNLSLIEDLNLRTVVLDKGRVIGDFESPRGVTS